MSAWIFLRGLMRESRHWGDFPQVFQHHLPEARVILQDLPGNGSLNKLQSPLHVNDMMAWCRQHLHAQGHRPPYYVLGLSMGGMVAAAWAQAYPEDLRGCVLINSSLRPFSPFYYRLYWRNYGKLLQLCIQGMQKHDLMLRERLVWELTTNTGSAIPSSLLDAWMSYQHDHPVSMANALRQLWAASRFRAQASAPKVPVLVLASAADRLVHPSCSLRLADAWQAPWHIHPDAGHDLPLQDGAWIAHQVARWHACHENYIETSFR
ncbi:alpha/beta fold hydrolase [Noviherbaspirillum sp. Root189]|uniref:alpha/beta fold hydrolase n=1 Tax=Noviherbaspirillum sp. Root189 TaxID=1736487 RepID=UPI00070C192A|nr:alpha/beta hydrolase [Noviherbaspirillum sp. Root189]KRB93126.1 hypothetical protein ASE07_14245 [Noviherbaspirillum sp. Root189]